MGVRSSAQLSLFCNASYKQEVSSRGQGKIEIHQGDCLEVMRELASSSVDAVLTDPPYGMSKSFGTNSSDKQENAIYLVQEAMVEFVRLLRMGGIAFVFGSPRLIHKTIQAGERAGLQFHRLLWLYKPNDQTYPWRGWLLKSEAIAVFSKGRLDPWNGISYCHDVYTFNHSGGELPHGMDHPSVKPLAVILDLVKKCPDGTILDPFAGSGTTGLAAQLEGMNAILIEQEPAYVEIIKQRLGMEAVA